MSYDKEVDAMMVVVREDTPVERTVEVRHGLVDLDQEGQVVAFELFDAGELLTRAVDLALTPSLEAVLQKALQQALSETRDKIAGDQPERTT